MDPGRRRRARAAKVGPRSAGAYPGPVCYGLGGTQSTVTDADLVLGYLDPTFFLGGRMRLHIDGAREAIERDVAAPLGLSVEEAAWGIHRIVNENMANAARVHAVERGRDPSALPLVAFGGAGPVHATGVARALGAAAVVAPRDAGVMSAFGLLAAPLAFDLVQSWRCELDTADLAEVNRFLGRMEAQSAALLREAGLEPEQLTHERFADLRYLGQGHEVRVPLPTGELDDVSRLVERFERAYERLYGRRGPRVGVEAMTWRVVSSGRARASGAASAQSPHPANGCRVCGAPTSHHSARTSRRRLRPLCPPPRVRVLRTRRRRGARVDARRRSRRRRACPGRPERARRDAR